LGELASSATSPHALPTGKLGGRRPCCFFTLGGLSNGVSDGCPEVMPGHVSERGRSSAPGSRGGLGLVSRRGVGISSSTAGALAASDGAEGAAEEAAEVDADDGGGCIPHGRVDARPTPPASPTASSAASSRARRLLRRRRSLGRSLGRSRAFTPACRADAEAGAGQVGAGTVAVELKEPLANGALMGGRTGVVGFR